MEYTLEATKREGLGTKAAQSIRAEGKLPAVVYGADVESTPIALDAQVT
jgi:large subunit ribosomal protein L25